MIDIPPEVLESARVLVAAERRVLQDKIRKQRRELRLISRAHQQCHLTLKDQYRRISADHKAYLEQSAMISRVMTELAEAKGWDLQARHYNAVRLSK